jgi:hypothetical protein
MPWEGLLQTVSKDPTDENQDAARVFADCVAIADGASSGFDSGRWAWRLVDAAPNLISAICETPVRLQRRWGSAKRTASGGWGSADPLEAARRQFDELQRRHDSEIPTGGSQYLQEARSRGASSTLAFAWLGANPSRLNLLSLGDTCWLLLDRDQSTCAFPYDHASEFPDQPRLLYSTPGRVGTHSRFVSVAAAVIAIRLREYRRTEIVQTLAFDPARHELLGCTDAVAQWLLTDGPSERSLRLSTLLRALRIDGAMPAEPRRSRCSPRLEKKKARKQGARTSVMHTHAESREFQRLIERERAAGRMRRDDSTAVLARWIPGISA